MVKVDYIPPNVKTPQDAKTNEIKFYSSSSINFTSSFVSRILIENIYQVCAVI